VVHEGAHGGSTEVLGAASPQIYQRLGVRTLVNAAGDLTRLGGTLMEPEVVAAMAEAAGAFVKLQELQDRAGELIARATSAEAGYVTAGAGAGLVLGVGACLAEGSTEGSMERLQALPDTSAFRRRRVVVQACHRTSYLRLFSISGAILDLVDGEEQLVTALARGDVAAVGFVHEQAHAGIPFERVIALARAQGVSVIVDAAAALPPPENLRRYTAAGADLVAFSGGKALHGPQATGILCGRADLIHLVSYLQQGTDLRPEPFPGHAVGRPMKVGKEEIAGLVRALELYVARDHEADRRRWERDMRLVAAGLSGLTGIQATYTFPLPNRRPLPCVLVHVDTAVLGRSALDVNRALEDGEPSIVLGEQLASSGTLVVYPSNLRPGEAQIVAERMRAVVTAVFSPGRRGPG
jgi:D-glucosaminate-6-phosphate ammonia-lyase